MDHAQDARDLTSQGACLMDENEKETVLATIQLAKIAIVAMCLVGGYLEREALMALVFP